jgi:hypothetical protein
MAHGGLPIKQQKVGLLILLLIALPVSNSLVFAIDPPTTIKGHVYYEMIASKPDELLLLFENQTLTPTIYDDGSYIISFIGEKPGSIGTFQITFDNETEEETITIQQNKYSYEKDLYYAGYYEPTIPPAEDSEPSTSSKYPPIAKHNGPYTGYVNTPLTFTAEGSTDPDGVIRWYCWYLGDDSFFMGESLTHKFEEEGNYTIMLRVTDNDGDKTTNITYALITPKPNHPPTNISLYGPQAGNQNISYEYVFYIQDLDNDTITYSINWGDGTQTLSDAYPSNTEIIIVHTFTQAGIFTITADASDNKTISESIQSKVIIDTMFVLDIGYMKDIDSDTQYDVFISNITKNQTNVIQNDDGSYLIDIDGDTLHDYVFDIGIMGLTEYVEEPNLTQNIINLFIENFFILIIIFQSIIILYLIYKIKRPMAHSKVYYFKDKNHDDNKKLPKNEEHKKTSQQEKFEDIRDHIDELLKKKNI